MSKTFLFQTILRMLHINFNKSHGEKAIWELQKNAACCFRQNQEATPHKTAAVRPLASHLINHPRRSRYAEHCWICKEKPISDLLWQRSMHGHTSVDRPANIYLHQLCADTGCSLEDQLGAIDDRDGWRQSERAKRSKDHVVSEDVLLLLWWLLHKYINTCK